MSHVQYYCLGFLFGPEDRVVLIRKNRPDWMAGKLNGIGGRVTLGETPLEAMVREFEEEAGCYLAPDRWEPFLQIHSSKAVVFCYRARTHVFLTDIVSQKTDEVVCIGAVSICRLKQHIVPDLEWLLPLACVPNRFGFSKIELLD